MERAPEHDTRVKFLVAPFGKAWEHWIVLGFAVASVAVLIALGVFVRPDPRGFGTHEQLGMPACKPMTWWNIPCPGCGVTTSVALAVHGHPWVSIVNQPFGFVVALMLPTFALWAFFNAIRGRDLAAELGRFRLGWPGIVLVVVMVLSWAYKFALVRHWFD